MFRSRHFSTPRPQECSAYAGMRYTRLCAMVFSRHRKVSSSQTCQEKLPAGNFRLLGLSDLALYGDREVNSRPNPGPAGSKIAKVAGRQSLAGPDQSPSLAPFPACGRPPL